MSLFRCCGVVVVLRLRLLLLDFCLVPHAARRKVFAGLQLSCQLVVHAPLAL